MAFPVRKKYIDDAESELGLKFSASILGVFDRSDVKRIKRTAT